MKRARKVLKTKKHKTQLPDMCYNMPAYIKKEIRKTACLVLYAKNKNEFVGFDSIADIYRK
jgi:hypothetical protein